ncbi:alpha/beta-type small acid-soluble spore protein [Thermoanaerobacterium sp. RBIITD]|uniref:alpha/beta-type small acid-soluble spore protein n=1 Tax=Thermoanaerobacterium sp. RBIITD TaxID=1550240 RepID=UPI000BB73458|nr:alpha/beta-type small acid-soluble spore protein [Thermoanaerobacterium sp. RBIITD]SNX55080.1 Small, acid-soluble spore protein, alpha/beta type [Thermoanaerobacterium sp. RBIITD]
MARGSWNDKPKVVPEAHQALDNLKYEIASEMGLPVKQGSEDYWGNLSSRDCGAVGGHMLRRMVQFAEAAMSNGTSIGSGKPAQGGAKGAAGSEAGYMLN